VNADLDRILSDFMDAWNAGRRPDVDEYLARAPDGPPRRELAEQITSWLTWAPTPDYDDATYEQIRAEPLVREVVAAVDQTAGLWPALLARLRRRSRMSTAELAGAISGPLGIAGREEKTARYLEDMESGRLDPSGVSRRVLEALARVLGIRDTDLEAAGDLGFRPTPGPALMRGEPGAAAEATPHLELLAEAMAAPSQEPWDEVDELFRGGR
jgi:Helix-turn-helix domain